MLAYPVLLGDVGGTNARFALIETAGGPLLPLPRQLTAAFADPVAALAAALAARPDLRPRAALLAVAARVEGPVVPLTNAGWVFDPARIGERLGLARVEVVNDYVPMAAAMEGLEPGDLAPLGTVAGAEGPRVVLGAGTGLGASALLPVGDRFLIQSTEAGHVEFGPAGAEEAALWALIEGTHGRITAETLLSGPGLHRLAHALARAGGEQAGYATPGDVVAAAGRGEAGALAALHLFGRLLGRFAGDLALLFGATGGVFIGGGIAPRIVAALDVEFRRAFEHKPPFDGLTRRIPTAVVTHPDPALFGLARLVAADGRFTYAASAWGR